MVARKSFTRKGTYKGAGTKWIKVKATTTKPPKKTK